MNETLESQRRCIMETDAEMILDWLDARMRGECQPVTVRYTYYWDGRTKVDFPTCGIMQKEQPDWLRCMDEKTMLKSTVLEVVNAPKELKGKWRHFFDEHHNIVVEYIPTAEEKRMQELREKGRKETMDIALMCGSF